MSDKLLFSLITIGFVINLLMTIPVLLLDLNAEGKVTATTNVSMCVQCYVLDEAWIYIYDVFTVKPMEFFLSVNPFSSCMR